ncbi:MAG: exo-beta-N-acetylmuramidase NamZ family protein [Gammaproteobacteria bacterium]
MLAAVFLLAATAGAATRTGLEVLAEKQFATLRGKRVGIVTNHTGTTPDGQRAIDLLFGARDVKLTAIFTPEHGISGLRDDPHIESGKDEATGVPIFSLYGSGSEGRRYRPTPEMMRQVDAIVFDIQDIGARFYTYSTTLGYMIEEAARARIPIYVLDRPNPINGVAVEGPLLDDQYFSFVGYMRMPIRHGMTIGELARMFNGERKIGAELHVIRVDGWRRAQFLDETALPWVNPSPNMRSLTQAILYPGVCLLESRQVSVGRGTETPFQMIGAPWLKGREMAEYLNGRGIAGARFIARRFRPNASVFKDQDCDGVEIFLSDRKALHSVELGIELLAAVIKLHPGKFDVAGIMRLLGNEATAAKLKAGEDPRRIVQSWSADLAAFQKIRSKYLLY